MRKQTKRKHYPLVNPLAYAMEGVAITPSDILDKLRIRELGAIESLSKGKATMHDWQALADMVNVAETMAKHGIGIEVLPAVAKAEQALLNATKRARLGFTGEELQTIRDLYEYHDLQRTSIARIDYEKMLGKTRNAILSGKAIRVIT